MTTTTPSFLESSWRSFAGCRDVRSARLTGTSGRGQSTVAATTVLAATVTALIGVGMLAIAGVWL